MENQRCVTWNHGDNQVEDSVSQIQPVTLPTELQDGYNANIVRTIRTVLFEFSLRTHKVQ
jgi:hypothetical protein